MGPVRDGGKFLTIEELAAQEVNDRRPVLIVNAAEKKWDLGFSWSFFVVKMHESVSPWYLFALHPSQYCITYRLKVNFNLRDQISS